MADRFIETILWGLPFWAFLVLISALTRSAEPLLLFGWLPWLFWILDAVVDHFHTSADLRKLMSRRDIVLATRAEYVGGHPELPHGRFCYLAIEGSRENPTLSMLFPVSEGQFDAFDVPLLDIGKTKPEASKEQGMADSILATLSERPGRLFRERVTLNVEYQGPGGRKHQVELTSFFRGNDEIRNWRNYLVCAQAEADTGVEPYGPWKSLKPAAASQQEVIPHDGSGDGSKLQPARRAFERR